jgi:hypothetical protein
VGFGSANSLALVLSVPPKELRLLRSAIRLVIPNRPARIEFFEKAADDVFANFIYVEMTHCDGRFDLVRQLGDFLPELID